MKALRFVIALALIARPVFAHPIHTTLTILATADGGRTITVSVRAFADDFSATVAAFAGKRAPADSSAVAEDVTKYVRAHFTFADASGVPLVMEPCGVRRANELYWLCYRLTLPAGPRGVKVRNQMLTELHPDQVNIVQLESGSIRKSYLFTKGSAASALGIQ
jgi:hypothetical protein